MLTSTLSVAPVEEGFELGLTVTNEGNEAVELSFRSGQRVDFVVETADGGPRGRGAERAEVWRYSDGRAFVQSLGRETLDPGESASYDAVWPEPPAGEYEVRGVSTAENVDVEATVSVTVGE
ncbi:MAG: BsuPI-related putative proteinase inhibitor [Haloferacaceae archaeon]